MTIQIIEGALQQLRATAIDAGGVAPSNLVQDNGFASELKAAIGKVSNIQQSARQQAQVFTLGGQNISLNNVMVDLQKSSISLQLGVQVRNKLVAAYQDIMNMPV
jgi:flagellar hook-basal body complex protein FliE